VPLTPLLDEVGYARRLIEVDLPIRRISEHARREKNLRHGHISTLHIWWARRPLAACRAVLLASLWPDPADSRCPLAFREAAARAMQEFRDAHGGPQRNWADGLELREALLDFIADFANWDNAADPDYLQTSSTLVAIAHSSSGGQAGTLPLVGDPFAGGGAIPLEALRVGADTIATDLNPVAVLLNKVVLEYIPRFGKRLPEELRKCGEWVKHEAGKQLSLYYPAGPSGETPIAYLWARNIKCEGPGCGAEVPLLRSLSLSSKGRNSTALRITPDKPHKKVEFSIVNGASQDVGPGTVQKGSATCPCCGYTTPVKAVRQQMKARHLGTQDARLVCVVSTMPGLGRTYRIP
jgi:putative DNA methylase